MGTKRVRQFRLVGAPRFSKATLTIEIQDRLDNIQRKHDFDPNNGYAQLAVYRKTRAPHLKYEIPDDAADIEEAVAYGALRALASLAFKYDLLFNYKRKRDFVIEDGEKVLDQED